jgi:hypothetical protein
VTYSSLIEFDDRVENDNNEGRDESNEHIIASLLLEFIAKRIVLLNTEEKK